MHLSKISPMWRRVVLVGLVLTTITACGPRKYAHSDLSGRGPYPTPYPTGPWPTPTGNPGYHSLGECNKVPSNSISLSGYFSTYYDPLTKAYRADYITILLKSIPTEVRTAPGYYVQVLRWKEATDGTRQVNTIPVKMYFIDKSTGQSLTPTGVDRISKATIEDAINRYSLGNIGYTAQNFFDRVVITATGIETQYLGTRLVYYFTEEAGPAVVGYVDALAPPYYADPNYFATTVKSDETRMLHPFYNLRNSGGSDADYYRMAEDICAEMVYTRAPASVATSSSLFARVLLFVQHAITLIGGAFTF